MKQDYQEKAKQIIHCLGGKENILSVTNCMTRLRTVVRDEARVDENGLKDLEDVMGLVHDRERAYEIVVGPGKSRKYADSCRKLGITEGVMMNNRRKTGPAERAGRKADADWKEYKDSLRSQKKGSRINSALKLIGDIFIPLIPGIITAGLCAGFASLISQLVPSYQDIKFLSSIHVLLTLVNTSLTTYLTAWAGYRTADRLGTTPILGGMLGMITSQEGINQLSQIIGLYDEASPLNSVLRAGKGGVLAVIAGVFLLSVLEKKIRSWMPESLDIICTPLLSLLICIIPYIFVIMPLFGYISGGVVWIFGKLCMSESLLIRIIIGYVSAALFLPMVAAGMHHGMVALYSVQLQELGYVTLYPALAMAGAGQVGAAIALWIKAKRMGNKKLCSVITGTLPAGFLGIGEPLIYGVTLPLGKPFITAGLGAGFGGALVMAAKVAATTWGPSGLLGVFVMTAGPRGAANSMLMYLAGLLISYICSFMITSFAIDSQTLAPEGEDHVEPDAPSVKKVKIYPTEIAAVATGKLIPMEDIPDPVFSSGTMGECIGILPENGTICAPCNGIVSSIAETKHAIIFTCDDGREILIHAGIDTVALEGKGFRVFVKEGDKVTKGQKVLEADLEMIREAGMSTMVITACLPRY